MQSVIGISENLIAQYRDLYPELNVPENARGLERLRQTVFHLELGSTLTESSAPARWEKGAVGETGGFMIRLRHPMREFSPLRDKTLPNVLLHLFATEFGFQHKMLSARAMVERILEAIDQFVQPASLLQPGQLLWMAMANDATSMPTRP